MFFCFPLKGRKDFPLKGRKERGYEKESFFFIHFSIFGRVHRRLCRHPCEGGSEGRSVSTGREN